MPKITAFEADRLSFIVFDINFMVNPYLIIAIKLRKPSFFASVGHRVGPTEPHPLIHKLSERVGRPYGVPQVLKIAGVQGFPWCR